MGGKLPEKLAQMFKEDFEKGMARVPEFNAHWMPVLQRAMAAYFFNFTPSPSNLYRHLAARIRTVDWDGACATLNYERLLELSLSGAGIRPVVGHKADANFELELVFPHGCCHIFCDAVRGDASGVSFSGIGVTTDGPVSVVADPAQFQTRISGDAFPPVMSYFEPTKHTSTGASFIAGQRKRLEDLIKAASTIAIIGVGVRPGDTHIWEPIASSEATIVYCGGQNGAESYRAWAKTEGKISSSLILEDYFAEELDKICKELDIP